MVIRCSFLASLESIKYYGGQLSELPSLPEYIVKKGPYVNGQEGQAYQIITIYEFDVMKFTEAWDCISKQLEAFRRIPGFTLSVRTLKKSREVKGCRISPQHIQVKSIFDQH